MTTAHVHVGDSGGAPMGISPDLLFSQGWGVTELDVHTAAGTEPGVIVNHTVIRGDQIVAVPVLMTLDSFEDLILTGAAMVLRARQRRE
jgi:hypothetical protein